MLKGYKLLGTGEGDGRRGSRYRSSEPMSGKSGEDVGNGDVPSPRSRFRHFRVPKPVITCLSTVSWLILPHFLKIKQHKRYGSGRIVTWPTYTGEPIGEMKLELGQEFYLEPLQMDDSKIWIQLKDLSTHGWDFGVSNSAPVPLSNGSTKRPLLDFIGCVSWQTEDLSWVKNMVTGKKVFQLSGRYARPEYTEWNGQYLVAGYESGEVLILDFCHLYPQ